MYKSSTQNFTGSRGTRTPEAVSFFLQHSKKIQHTTTVKVPDNKLTTNTIQKLQVNPRIESRYRSSSNSQRSPATVQAANQIVPYGGGHHSGQLADASMALSYAFDNRGKLKRLDIASNGAMMNLLQQIGRRSMQQCLDIHLQSTNQFPTLTHLHVDEISKGAQKLNQILKACSRGINNGEGPIEIGNELWKGAMELEQSLRMLVSLQEASENTKSQRRRTHLKLIDDNGDSEDDRTVSSQKQKQVERPVFSFDKPSKNTKASVQTDLQQKLTALPYLEDSSSKPERHMAPKSSPHRRTASCGPEFQTSQLTNSSHTKHNAARLPNVIAKLMGLEELPQNINSKVSTESPHSQQKSMELVSIHTAERSKSVNLKMELAKNNIIQVNQNKVQSSKITVLATHKIELQEDTYRSNSSHKTKHDKEKPKWNEEEREGVKNYVKESKAAMSKINELQNKIMHLNQDGGSPKGITKEAETRKMKQKQQELADAKKTSQQMVAPQNRSLDIEEIVQADTPANSNIHETQKTSSKPLLPREKQNRSIQLQQMSMLYGPQGKKLKAEKRSQQITKSTSGLRKREHKSEKLPSTRDLRNLQKQPIKQRNARKKIAEDVVLAASKALLTNRQNDKSDSAGRSMNPDDKRESSVCLKSDQNSHSIDWLTDSQMTEVTASSNKDTKCTHDSPRKVVSDIKTPNVSPRVMTKEEITKRITNPRALARAIKPQRPTPHRLQQSKLNTINFSTAAAEANETISKSTKSIQGNQEPNRLPINEKSQQNMDAEKMDNRNNTVRDKHSLRMEEATQLNPGDGGEYTISTVSDDQQEHLIPHEADVRLQITATDGQEDCKINSCDRDEQQAPLKIEKQEPLTEDELFLKQKLITSHLFLNTAEALFKLNIPISILNYASDQICEEKDSKMIVDSGYELLKRKGRRELFYYPSINVFNTCTGIRSLDDLVRQLHKDFQALRSYGRNRRDEYDYANCILQMLENDIYNRYPNLNCMWDYGWNEVKFPYAKMDEVISSIEQLLLDELLSQIIDYL
ncbi:hypothetical protein BVRB_5g108250 isoform A [Beta vulgaris subsp. vulgaris]|nr:hypothetical protein BVRB_5g108250 isoform A [Beta vulgaris subsp. vulgaris]